MDIESLAEFCSLVETHSFQETAARMNISQSALTKHIHKMEEELNITLFDRSQRSIRINEYSQRFYPHAKQILQIYSEATAFLHELNDQERISVTVAYNPIVGQYGLVDTLLGFSAKHPEYNLKTNESYHSLDLLKEKRCDFAFVGEGESEGSDFSRMIYKTDHLAVVVPENHPLASQDTVTLDALRQEHFILHSSHTDLPHDETKKFLSLCESQQFVPDVVGESQFSSTMLRYVRMGRGIAVLNRMHIPHDVSNVRILDIYPKVHSYIYLLYRRRIASHCAADFLHYIIDQCSAEG